MMAVRVPEAWTQGPGVFTRRPPGRGPASSLLDPVSQPGPPRSAQARSPPSKHTGGPRLGGGEETEWPHAGCPASHTAAPSPPSTWLVPRGSALGSLCQRWGDGMLTSTPTPSCSQAGTSNQPLGPHLVGLSPATQTLHQTLHCLRMEPISSRQQSPHSK